MDNPLEGHSNRYDAASVASMFQTGVFPDGYGSSSSEDDYFDLSDPEATADDPNAGLVLRRVLSVIWLHNVHHLVMKRALYLQWLRSLLPLYSIFRLSLHHHRLHPDRHLSLNPHLHLNLQEVPL